MPRHGQRRRRSPTDVRLRPEERLRRLRRRRRRRARRDHTYDSAEYLVKVHKAEGTALDTDFRGTVPESVTYHAPCHLRAQNIGLKSRDLIKLTGTKVTVVAECSGIDGTWGLRAENFDIARGVAAEDGDAIEKAGRRSRRRRLLTRQRRHHVGDRPRTAHPIQVVARAYGIAEERRIRSRPQRRPSGRSHDANSPSTTSPTCAPTSASASDSAGT